jgi:predicted enzyme related to lactoylglutathione lyase
MRWVHVSIDAPAQHAEAVQRFWAAALGCRVGEPWARHTEFRSLEPKGSGDGYVHVQTIEAGSASVHFDLASERLPNDLDRMVALGAEQVASFDGWHVLRSPGGLEFCLVPSSGSIVPPATTWPGGHRSRLVQLCIDSPASLHDEEVAFWQSVTGWRFEDSDSPEFAGKLFPPQPAPVQFLLQRLGADDDRTRTHVHIDLGTDDIDAEVRRLEALGAKRGSPGQGWVQLTDPSGMAFCATANAPD